MGKNDFENHYKGNSNGGINDQPFGSADYFDDAQGEDSRTVYLFAPIYDKSYEYASYQLVKDEIIAQLQQGQDWNYSTGEALKALIKMHTDFDSVMSESSYGKDSEFRPSEMALKIRYKLRARWFEDDMVNFYHLIVDNYCT